MKTLHLALLALLVCPPLRSSAQQPVKVVAPGQQPDSVATAIMHEPVFPFSVHSVAFSPDGHLLAAGDGTGTVRLWEMPAGKLHTKFKPHETWVFTLAWFPDGRLATGGGDDLIQVFAPTNLLHSTLTLRGHSNDVHSIAISSDGKTLFSAGDDRTVIVWNALTGQSHSLTGHTLQIPAVDLSPDDRLLASGSRDDTIRLWPLDSISSILGNHSNDVMAVRFSPDGRWLASAGFDGAVKLWDIPARKLSKSFPGHAGRAVAVAFHPRENWLVSAGDEEIRFWNLTTEENNLVLRPGGRVRTEDKHEVAERISSLDFHPDGSLLAAGSTTSDVYLISWPEKKVVRVLRATEK